MSGSARNTALRERVWLKYREQGRGTFFCVCFHCGERIPGRAHMTVEHIIPRSRGGTNQMQNLRPACHDCNNGRGDTYHPAEAEVRELLAAL